MTRSHDLGYTYGNFADPLAKLTMDVRNHGHSVDPGHWQGYSTVDQPSLRTRELTNVQFSVRVDRPMDSRAYDGRDLLEQLAHEIEPNLAWADEHFEERIGGVPMNPDPSHERWPWWQGQEVSKQVRGGKFTHTYSERFWPRRGLKGIRYTYGNYNDLCLLLIREKYTRQAYMPIFFPEDTGASHQGRIPCTLGYHFMVRPDVRRVDRLDLWYFLRSCDVVRHFRDDVYLAVRLMLKTIEVCWTSGEVAPGTLHMTIPSLHIHMGDIHRVQG